MNYIQKIKAVLKKKIEVEEDLLDLYTLVVLLLGEQATLQDIHDAWAVWKNKTMSNHRSLIPFSKLEPDVQELDREFMNAIHETAREVM